jgi:hypothetical protein
MSLRRSTTLSAVQAIGDMYLERDSSIASNVLLAELVVHYEHTLRNNSEWIDTVALAKKLLLAKKRCRAKSGLNEKLADASRLFRKKVFKQLKKSHNRISQHRHSNARLKPVPVLGDGEAVVGVARSGRGALVAKKDLELKPGERIVRADKATDADWVNRYAKPKVFIVQVGTLFLEEGMVRSVCGGTWSLAWEDYKTRYENNAGVGDTLRLEEREHKRITKTNNVVALAEMSRKILESPLAILDNVIEVTPEVEAQSRAFLEYFKLLLGSGIVGYKPDSDREVAWEDFVATMKAKIKLLRLNGTSFLEWVEMYFLHHEHQYNTRLNTIRGGTGWENHKDSILAENKIRSKKDFLRHLYRRMLKGHRIL